CATRSTPSSLVRCPCTDHPRSCRVATRPNGRVTKAIGPLSAAALLWTWVRSSWSVPSDCRGVDLRGRRSPPRGPLGGPAHLNLGDRPGAARRLPPCARGPRGDDA